MWRRDNEANRSVGIGNGPDGAERAGPGKGADLGGLAGADAHCSALAKAAGAGNRQWHAYLSATAANGQPVVNAKDRIGAGPWFNAKGVQVAANVADLHSDNNKLSKENSLTEKGDVVKGRGDTPNQHDILTGTNLDGTVSGATCNNWTSSAGDSSATVGHFDRQGGGANPTSWHSARALLTIRLKTGTATTARTMVMPRTTMASSRVNPRWAFRIVRDPIIHHALEQRLRQMAASS